MSLSFVLAVLLWTQSPPTEPLTDRVLAGGVPSGAPVPEVLDLTLSDAIARGLRNNLGLLLGDQRVRSAQGAEKEALAELLPHLNFYVSETRQKLSLEAFGFTRLAALPGLNTIVGPFNVFDTRLQLTETLFDFGSYDKVRAERSRTDAARRSYQDLRDAVVLLSANLYMRAAAEQSRIDAARAQLDTAQALHELALDRKRAGLVPAVDVLRADVQRAAREQQAIAAETRFLKAKLVLARAIGLPIGQQYRLADRVAYSPGPTISLEDALRSAYASRSDWKAAEARVRAAEAARRSASGERLPSLEVWGDYGLIGATPGGSRDTFTIGAAIRFPFFDGGRTAGKVTQAEAVLQAETAMREDLRARIHYEVESASLDLRATEQRVAVAERAVGLAREELTQARDRFQAGVGTNIEVVEAQESVAAATESYIASVYEHNVAKAALARALGTAESSYQDLLRGH